MTDTRLTREQVEKIDELASRHYRLAPDGSCGNRLIHASKDIRALIALLRQREEEVARLKRLCICSICSVETDLACSDCQIDFRTTIYVCQVQACRDKHEEKCSANLRAQLAAMTQQLELGTTGLRESKRQRLELEEQLAQRGTTVAHLVAQLAERTQERDDAIDAREGTYIRVDGLQVEVFQLKQQLAAAQATIDAWKHKFEDMYSAYQSDMDGAKQREEKLKNERGDARNARLKQWLATVASSPSIERGPAMTDPRAGESNCDLCEGDGPVRLFSRCHLGGPLMLTIDGQEIVVRCYLPECRREVLRIPFQKGCEHL